MIKLYKPFEGHPDYNCFGCSPGNPIGLNLEFNEDGEYVIAEWRPRAEFQGFKNVLHGGIQSTLMDEIAAWCVNIKMDTAGVTKELKVRFLKSVYTTDTKIILRARLIKTVKNIAFIHVELLNSKDELCSEGEFNYFTFPKEIAKRKLLFPGKEAFYKRSPYL